MKKYFPILLFLISSSVQAQLLWQISNKSSKNTSYLVGTHELIPAKALDSIAGIYRAFNRCNVVISKHKTYSIDSENQLKKAALLPFNKTIKDYISDTVTYKKVDAELKQTLKIGLKELGRLHPAMIRQLYLSELFNIATKIKDDAQSDSYFQRVAGLKEISVVGLEDYNQYITTLFAASKTQLYINKLISDINNKSLYVSNFTNALHSYQTSNLKACVEYLKQSEINQTNEAEAVYSTKQFDKLKSLMQVNNCFIIVDIMQLESENGAIEQLRKAGYDVKPYVADKLKKKH